MSGLGRCSPEPPARLWRERGRGRARREAESGARHSSTRGTDRGDRRPGVISASRSVVLTSRVPRGERVSRAARPRIPAPPLSPGRPRRDRRRPSGLPSSRGAHDADRARVNGPSVTRRRGPISIDAHPAVPARGDAASGRTRARRKLFLSSPLGCGFGGFVLSLLLSPTKTPSVDNDSARVDDVWG